MPTYTVHVPAGIGDDAARADGTVFVREGFGWGAFLLGPLALLYRGLWRATLAWAAAAALLLAVAHLAGLGFGPRLALYLVLATLAGLEAADARRAALARAGFIASALVSAGSRGEVERRFFADAAPLLEPLPSTAAPARRAGGVRAVIGLFPPSGPRA